MPHVTSHWLYVKQTDVLIDLYLNSHVSPLAIVLGRADMEHFNYCTASYWTLLELEQEPWKHTVDGPLGRMQPSASAAA